MMRESGFCRAFGGYIACRRALVRCLEMVVGRGWNLAEVGESRTAR